MNQRTCFLDQDGKPIDQGVEGVIIPVFPDMEYEDTFGIKHVVERTLLKQHSLGLTLYVYTKRK